MLKPEYTVVKRTEETNEAWGLKKDTLYAVETDTDFVDEDDHFITVWNDEGKLAEMYDGEYEVVAADQSLWFRARPEQIFVEIL